MAAVSNATAIKRSWDRLAVLGEQCEGYDEFTGQLHPHCEEGLVCEYAPGCIDIGKTCQEPQDKLLHTCPEGEFFRDDVCMCSVGHAALIFCPDDTIPDPYNGSSCLTYDEFNFLYAHTMGPDCIEGTHDDFFLTTNSSQEYCADGEIFDEEICSCTYQAQCLMSCPPGMDFDPRFACQCEWEANIQMLYEHGLGETCGATNAGGIGDQCSTDNECLPSLLCESNICTEFIVFPEEDLGPEKQVTDADREILNEWDLIYQLELSTGYFFDDITAVSYRSKVVPGLRQAIVKYHAVDPFWGGDENLADVDELYFLAKLYQLPDTNEPIVVDKTLIHGVTADSAIPDNI